MKKFKVGGYAMVPCFVEITVEAETEEYAKLVARSAFRRHQAKRQLIVPGTTDEACVHDFEPTEAEEQP